MTEDLIQEDPIPKKKVKTTDKKEVIIENDEHEGMDHQSLITHEMHTKLKTIDSIEFG